MNSGGWTNYSVTRDNIIGKEISIHLVPNDDYRPHDLDESCWCKPVEEEPSYFLHNSLDGREAYEEGRRLQ